MEILRQFCTPKKKYNNHNHNQNRKKKPKDVPVELAPYNNENCP
jgi:hypothetical protein